MEANDKGRKDLDAWQKSLKENSYLQDSDFRHSVSLYFDKRLDQDLAEFGRQVVEELEPLVVENNLYQNLPRLERYDGIGNVLETIVHHPSYAKAGNIIYRTRLMERMSKPGGLLEALTFMFLSSQAGEAGHNCPIACSAGIVRIFQKVPDFPNKSYYLSKLLAPSYTDNFTGAQFLTEVQGGSDVGLNATEAYQEEGKWKIRGEKWFCSNADAELILLTARYDPNISGTKGLGLFLVPAFLESGEHNRYTMRRLKDKIGTRSMASAEIDFQGAEAIAMGEPQEGFKLVMENVLHISRLFNTFCMLGMVRRAFQIAKSYAEHRIAFGQPIISYPLIRENLAVIKVENNALLASIFATVHLQDQFDTGLIKGEETKLLLRLLANLNKYLSALWSVEHLHHCLDVLAGNGAIESFSTIPRLLRDSIVCENWEGTHNVLRMQILRDMQRYHVDAIFLDYVEKLLPQSEKYAPIFKNSVEQLKSDLKTFKEASPELQSLQIKSVVDQMALLFVSVALLKEGLSQAQSVKASKLNSLDYFLSLHPSSTKPCYDPSYLRFLDAVVLE